MLRSDETKALGYDQNEDPRFLKERIRILEKNQASLVTYTESLAHVLQVSRDCRIDAEDECARMRRLAEFAIRILMPFADLAERAGTDIDETPGDVSIFLHQSFHHMPPIAFANARNFMKIARPFIERLPPLDAAQPRVERTISDERQDEELQGHDTPRPLPGLDDRGVEPARGGPKGP